ncbi:hypothetical protein [Gracilibacillus salinarum]|uniref:GerMN domain-containing protein n=1 Tax=Gracilibacillus salinarum TaxID=2932255 RepID=A0ABY4GPK8_9BACI|nr:hypothetical protein [Gracilibacillus salinarum]UOQ85910.1 hypothetical protein MUN87_03095 [Gracilibacillus salinarum]
MNKDNDNVEQLKEQLRSMPKVKDERSKNEIYRQIQLKMIEQEEKKQRKKRWVWIPAISTAACALLVFMVFLTQDKDRITQFEESSSSTAADEAQIETFESQENSIQRRDAEESAEMEKAGESDTSANDSSLQYQLEILPKEDIQQFALITTPAQYLVPVTFSKPDITEPITFQNSVREIDLAANGLQDIGLQHMTFTEEQQRVQVSVQDDFILEPDHTNKQLFDQIINWVFQDTEVNQIHFNQTNDFIDQINMVGDTYKLKGSGTAVYKQYQYNSQASAWLAATKIGQFESIDAALNEMKVSEQQYHVTSTIPSDAEIEIESSKDNTLSIRVFSEDIGQNQRTVNMVEAIIATANSFGYESVHFQIGYDQVGKYNLTKAVPTDQQMNVIYRGANRP